LDRLFLVLAYCTRTLIVDSGASAFADYLSQRSCQILGTPDFIDEILSKVVYLRRAHPVEMFD